MLTNLYVSNFKRFHDAEVELGEVVLLVGPNNSGKTTALQALALWDLGVRRLAERHGTEAPAKSRPGVAINRRDLIALPVPTATMLFSDAHAFVKSERRRIEITVKGVTRDLCWEYGIEVDYDNEESVTVRPRRMEGEGPRWMAMPQAAREVRVALLPPMSGLTSNETRIEPGAIAVRIGEGRTAEVLRNLCHRVSAEDPAGWVALNQRMEKLFGVTLDPPLHRIERGEIEMSYVERDVRLDLSCAGRGLQQTLLLLAYLQTNRGAVLLLDEPDAHLEILRQRQIYSVLTTAARESGSQIIAASHSEVLLNEAADRDMVIAFVGKPHRIDDRGSQVGKALREIGFEHYYQAEQKGWVLYLEGSTDLEVLSVFARTLGHPAAPLLEKPFVEYVGNNLPRARRHFHGLKEAKHDLVGVALLDRDAAGKEPQPVLRELFWSRREIENYLCAPDVLLAYSEQSGVDASGPLFAKAEANRRRSLMEELIRDLVPPAALRDATHRYWRDFKASDDFLDPVFETYFAKLDLPNLMRKSAYHQLAALVPVEAIDPEVREKLDVIAEVASLASPRV